jgi:hypothetical protein
MKIATWTGLSCSLGFQPKGLAPMARRLIADGSPRR